MQLNNQIPGLPDWPPIRFYKDSGECVVGGPHVSYRRYVLARTLSAFLMLGYIAFALFVAAIIPKEAIGPVGCVLVLPIIIAAFVPVGRLLCQWFFPRRTIVRFTPRHIIVNNKTYENSPNIPVQFRANRPHLTEGDYYERILEKKRKGKVAKGLAYELKFHKLEMIYGSRIVPITSLADEDRAAQFAIALQSGYELAALHYTSPFQTNSAGSATPERSLPE